MEGPSALDSLVEFIRVRQLNVVVVAVLTLVYLVYQYWGSLFKEKSEDNDDSVRSMHRLNRSRSRSKSRNRSGHHDQRLEKHGRSNRRGYGKCPDCSKCKYDD